MTRPHIPQTVLDAAHARSAARAARDWDEADRLRAKIEAAGWTIVDRGTDFALSPVVPADVVDGDRIRYGSSASVPTRWDEPVAGTATIVLVARDTPEPFARALAAVLATAPDGTSVVIIADGPSAEQAGVLEAAPPASDRVEVVWTRERLGDAAAANIGIRRARGPIVILLDHGVRPTGDIVSPLVAALEDPTVAITGGWGTTSTDLRHFAPAEPGDVDAIDAGCQAFRRADAAARGPLDERFRSRALLATWWSLVLRDEGDDVAPRRAVAIADLALSRGGPDADLDPAAGLGPERDPASRRDRYRIIDRFGWRRDLLVGG